MAQEIASLGFSHVELSHGIRMVLVPGILRAVEEKVIQVASTHNFCPLPPGITQAAPNLFEPTAPDPRERDQWLRYTKRSVEFASQLGAKALVCHLGSVGFRWFNPALRLRKFVDEKGEGSGFARPDFPDRVKKTMSRIQERMAAHWDRLLDSLRGMEGLAKEKNVRLGFENRERVEELPLDPDFGALFAALGPETQGGYWHDTGHADLKQRYGLLDHRVHLRDNAGRLLGFHLHDVDPGGNDHQALGEGTIDFEMVSEFWREEHILVLELSPNVELAGVQTSKERIEALIASRRLSLAR